LTPLRIGTGIGREDKENSENQNRIRPILQNTVEKYYGKRVWCHQIENSCM